MVKTTRNELKPIDIDKVSRTITANLRIATYAKSDLN